MQMNFAPSARHGMPWDISPNSPTNCSQGGLSIAGKRLAELLSMVWLNFLLSAIFFQPCEVLAVCEPQSRVQKLKNLPAFICKKPCEVQQVSGLKFRLVCIWLCAKKRKVKQTCDQLKFRLECTRKFNHSKSWRSGFWLYTVVPLCKPCKTHEVHYGVY